MKQNKEKENTLKISSKGFTLIELIITVIAIGIFGAITANISSNIYYYNNQNNLVTNNSDANSVSLNRISILFNHPTHGYSMNLDSYVSPYNFRFGKPMDYHE